MAVRASRGDSERLYESDPFYEDLDNKLFSGEKRERQPVEKDEDQGEFSKGFGAGVDQTFALGGAAKAAVGSMFGNDEWVRDGLDYYQEQMDLAAENAPAVTLEDDWEGISDTADFFAYTLGNVLPSLVTTIAGGGVGGFAAKVAAKKIAQNAVEKRVKSKFDDAAKAAADEQIKRRSRDQYKEVIMRRYAKPLAGKAGQKGALAGGFAVSSTLGTGENFSRILEETGLEDPGAAMSLGIAMGALDTVGAPFRAFKRMFPNESIDGLKSHLAEAAVEDRGRITKMFEAVANPKSKLGQRAVSGLKEAGIGAVREGVTEATQEWLSRTSVLWAKENLSEEEQARFEDYLSSEDAMSGYYHAMVTGAVGGTAIGGTVGLISGADNTGRLDPAVEQQRQEVRVAQREAAAVNYDNAGDQSSESNLVDLPDFSEQANDALFNALSVIEESGSLTVNEIVETSGLDTASQQETLDILEERGFVESDIDQDGVISYGLTETGSALLVDGDIVASEILGIDDGSGQQADTSEQQQQQQQEQEQEQPVPTQAQESTVPSQPVVDNSSQLEGLDGLDREFAEMELESQSQPVPLQGTDAVVSSSVSVGGDVPFVENFSDIPNRAAEIDSAAGQTKPQQGGDDDFVAPSLGGVSNLLRQILGIENAPQVEFEEGNPITLSSLGSSYEQDSPQVTSALNAIMNVIERGMPSDVMKLLKGVYVYTEGQNGVPEDAAAAHFELNGSIGLGAKSLEALSTADGAAQLMINIAHEMWHLQDTSKGYTSSLPGLKVVLGQDANGNANIDLGAVSNELYDSWVSGSELGQFFDYPFSYISYILDGSNNETVSNTIKREVFAQLGALYISNPRLLKQSAPKAYKLMRDIQSDSRPVSEIRDARKRTQAEAPVTSGAEIQGDVRSPTSDGVVEVPDTGGVGVESPASSEDGSAGQELGGEEQGQDGDESGRVLQEGLGESPATAEPAADVAVQDDSQENATSLVYETRIKLAGAYLEMDDPVAARDLIEDVYRDGTEEQKQRANDFLVENELLPFEQQQETDKPELILNTNAETEGEGFDRLQNVDSSYNETKVRTLSQLQQRIPLNERIAGEYTEGQPLTPISGGAFSDLDLSNRGEGLSISQESLEGILEQAITQTDTNEQGQVGSLARDTVERLEINANTVGFWDRALRLSDNARYWYEVSAESMRETLPDLTDAEIKQFISVVAATSPVANPFVNMHRALASYANHLQGKPIDNDLVIQKGVTDALKTADLEGLKTGSFGGTMQLVLGMSKPTLSTNDRQVAATFNTDGEEIGKNPILYEVMSRFYLGLRDNLNANIPEGTQPFETWQLQALGWVEQRYKNEFIETKKAEGMSPEEAQSAYEVASQEEVSGGTNDVDDYSMSLLRKDSSGRRDRKGAIQVLEEAGIPVADNKITREILLDSRVPAALSPTTAVFREKRVITAEINSLRNKVGTESRRVYDAAIDAGNTKIADEYHGIFAVLLNKSSQGKTNPFTSYFSALGLNATDAKPTRVSVPTKQNPLTVGGSYEGDISPNIRVPVPASITPDQLNIVMTSLSKVWDQDAVPAAHIIDIADGLREGYTETSQVFVETLDVLSREQIEAFAAALPEGSEINFTRFPNGYEFNVFTFDQETFDPSTPNPNDVESAAAQILAINDLGITAIDVKDAQFQPAGYSEIDNYDDVFAQFQDSLYNVQAQQLAGKVQRKVDGKLKDLTEKQIVKELRRTSSNPALNGQSNARIQRANGVIRKRLGDFQQAEEIARKLAVERDSKLKLFAQKNAKKLAIDTPELTRSRPAQSADPILEQAVQDRVDRKISAEELNQIMDYAGRPVRALTRSEAEEIVTLPSDEKALNALNRTSMEGFLDGEKTQPKPRKETYFESFDLADGQEIASRLDIPSYDKLPQDEQANIVTVHEPKKSKNPVSAGKRVGYTKTMRLRNGTFNVSSKGAVKIGTGKKNKDTIATMQGEYVKASNEENLTSFLNAIDDPDWTQVSMNPRRHSTFYTVDTQQPVLSFGDAIQVGNFVIAKNVERGEIDSAEFIKLESGAKPGSQFNLKDEVEVEARLANKVNEKFREKFVDRYERWRTVEDAMARQLGLTRLPAEISFRDAENLMHSRAEDQLSRFEDEHMSGIADLANKYDLTVDQIGLYLLAKHAPERNAAMLAKEVERREKKLAQITKQLEDSITPEKPEGSPAIQERLEATQEAPYRHIDTGSGMTDDQAQTVLDNAETAGNKDQYEQIANKVYAMLTDMREGMVKKGLLDEETKNDWEANYEFYVPLKGFEDVEGANTSNPRAKGFNIQGSESMKARGRVTLPQNPLLNSFKDAEEKIVRAEKNYAAQKLLKLVQKFTAVDEWDVWTNKRRPPKRYDSPETMSLDDMGRATRDDDGMPRFIQVKRGGQTFFVEIKDARLNRQLQDGNAKALNQANEMIDVGMSKLRTFQNFRRNVIINWNPSWFFVNPIRDIETGLAYLISEQTNDGGRVQGKELVGKVMKGWMASGKAYFDYNQGKTPKNDNQKEIFKFIEEFIADGAPTGLATSKSLAEIQKQLEKSMPREVKVRGKTIMRTGSQGSVGRWKDGALDWIEHANQSSENAIRLSTYIEARKAGTPRLDAATLAKDLTVNFNRKGEWNSTIDTGYLFFNAAVQGNVNLKDALGAGGDAAKSRVLGLGLTAARKAAMGLFAFGFARTMANIMFSDEDDDGESLYADYSPFKLASTMALTIGDQAFGAPLAYGWGWFDNIGRIMAEQTMGVRDPVQGAIDIYTVTQHHFSPRGFHSVNSETDSLGQAFEAGVGFLPDVLSFGAEQGMNVNFFGSPIVMPTPFDDAPASSVSKRGTMESFKVFSKAVNEWTGGTEYTKGVIDMSPDRLQHLFDFMLGGLGRFGTDAADTVQKTVIPEAESLESSDVPIWRNFVFNPSEYNDQFRYYDNRADIKREMELWENSNEQTRDSLVTKRSREFYKQLPMKLKSSDKILRSNRKEIRRIEGLDASGRIANADKLARLKAANDLIYDKFNEQFKKFK